MRVDFYHLTAMPLERLLPRICERLLDEGERLLVVAAAEQLAQLDTQLWSYARDGFLPHGLASDGNAERQPILLADHVEPANGARNIALADGEWREEALAFQRIFHFFAGDRLEAARETWRSVKSTPDAEPHYWRQDDRGKWTEGP
jgi:DNA polymerase III subunit chi